MRQTGTQEQRDGRNVWRYRIKTLTAVLLAMILFAGTAAPALAEETPAEAAPEAAIVGAGEVKSGTCGKDGADVRWEFKDGVLTISGSGEMDSYYEIVDWYTGETVDSNVVPWVGIESQIRKVIVKDGVTLIGNQAFLGLSNLESAVIAGSVKTIGNEAFANNLQLEEIVLEEGIEKIGGDAFYGAGPTTLTLPTTLRDASGLRGLRNLEEFRMDRDGEVYRVRDGILYDKDNVLVSFPIARTGSFIVPDGVTGIGSGAFYRSNLSALSMPDSVTWIGTNAFSGAAMEEIEFSGSLELIPDFACWYAQKLKKVTLKEGIKTIGRWAFESCSCLSSILIPGTVEEIQANSFDPETELIFTGEQLYRTESGTYLKAVMVDVEGESLYSYAFEVLDLVNKERAKEGLEALTMDKSLLDTAMQRAYETVVLFSHDRPSGESCFTANDLMCGENIAWGQSTPEEVMNSWMNSEGHRANILGSGFKSVGVGCVNLGYKTFWVQCFGFAEADEALSGDYRDGTAVRTAAVKKDDEHFNPIMAVFGDEMGIGDERDVTVRFGEYGGAYFKSRNAVIESDNPEVCRVDGTRIVGGKAGKATISLYYKGAEDKLLTGELWVYKDPDALYDYIADVNDWNSYYYYPVHWAYAFGITTGRGDYFKPNDTCTRAEAVTFLYRLAGEPAVSGTSPFSDITDQKAWYYKAVLWAVQNGITTGYGKDAKGRDVFKPNVTCSRAMIVTLIKRYAEKIEKDYEAAGGNTEPFPDVSLDKWYCEPVRWAAANEITTGKGDGKFYPDEGCTRAQIVTFLYRYAVQ